MDPPPLSGLLNPASPVIKVVAETTVGVGGVETNQQSRNWIGWVFNIHQPWALLQGHKHSHRAGLADVKLAGAKIYKAINVSKDKVGGGRGVIF